MPAIKRSLEAFTEEELPPKKTRQSCFYSNALCKLLSNANCDKNAVLEFLSKGSLTDIIGPGFFYSGTNVLLMAAINGRLHYLPKEQLESLTEEDLIAPFKKGPFAGRSLVDLILKHQIKYLGNETIPSMNVFLEVLAPKVNFDKLIKKNQSSQNSIVGRSLILLCKGRAEFFEYLTKNHSKRLTLDTLMCLYRKEDGTECVPLIDALKSTNMNVIETLGEFVGPLLTPENVSKCGVQSNLLNQTLFSARSSLPQLIEKHTLLLGPNAKEEKKKFIQELNNAKTLGGDAKFSDLIESAANAYQEGCTIALQSIAELVARYGNSAAKIQYALTLKAVELNIFTSPFPYTITKPGELKSRTVIDTNEFNLQNLLDNDINPKLVDKGLVISPYCGLTYDDDESSEEEKSDTTTTPLSLRTINRRALFDKVIGLPIFDDNFDGCQYDDSETGTVIYNSWKSMGMMLVLSDRKIHPDIPCETVYGAIMFQVRFNGTSTTRIELLGIDANEQGKGFGSILLQAAMYIGSTLGSYKFSLQSTSEGKKTYVRHGMKCVGKEYDPDDFDIDDYDDELEVDYTICNSVQTQQCKQTFAKGINVYDTIVDAGSKIVCEHQRKNSLIVNLKLGSQELTVPDWLFEILSDLHKMQVDSIVKPHADEYIKLFYKQQVKTCVAMVQDQLSDALAHVNNRLALQALIECKERLQQICEEVCHGIITGDVAQKSRDYVKQTELNLISINQLTTIVSTENPVKIDLTILESEIQDLIDKIKGNIHYVKVAPNILEGVTKQLQTKPAIHFAYEKQVRRAPILSESEEQAIFFPMPIEEIGLSMSNTIRPKD